MTSVWVTRAAPGAEATAQRVRALGLEPWIAPLLEVCPMGRGPIDLTGVGALAFTSANGVRAFVARSAAARELPVFAVGAATARAARDVGFTTVRSAEGDVRALTALIAATAPPPAGLILHPGPAEPAGDLTGHLRALGFAARRLDIYRTVELEPAGEDLARLMTADFALLHSPRAARVLRRVMGPGRSAGRNAKFRLLCLSPAVAAPLEGLDLVSKAVADAPSEAALIALLARGAG